MTVTKVAVDEFCLIWHMCGNSSSACLCVKCSLHCVVLCRHFQEVEKQLPQFWELILLAIGVTEATRIALVYSNIKVWLLHACVALTSSC